MFFKIPHKFKIETPIGTYNPDRAVYIDRDGVKKISFVLKTKGSLNFLERRDMENLKIHCGKEHFKALDDDLKLKVAKTWKQIKKEIV